MISDSMMSKSSVDMFNSSQSSANKSSVDVWGISVWHAASFPILRSDERIFRREIVGVYIRISESFTPWRHKYSTQLIVALQVMLRLSFVLLYSWKSNNKYGYEHECLNGRKVSKHNM